MAGEANVFMRELYSVNPYLFLSYKVIIINMLIMFIGVYYDKVKSAKIGIIVCLLAYSFVIFCHIYGVYLNFYLNTEYYV
jgi:hypothetical protein